MPWSTNLRKIALIAFVTTVSGALYPFWSLTRQVTAASSQIELWGLGVWVIGVVLTALPLVFLFALYRDQTVLQVPERLRRLAGIAAFIFAAIIAVGMVQWIRAEGSYFDSMSMLNWAGGGAAVRDAQGDPRTLTFLSGVLNELGNLASLALLIALSRATGNETESEVPASSLLRRITRVTLIAGYFILAFQVLRLAYMPYLYSTLRARALVFGEPVTLVTLLRGVLHDMLFTASLVTIPFIVSRSFPPEPEIPDDAE